MQYKALLAALAAAALLLSACGSSGSQGSPGSTGGTSASSSGSSAGSQTGSGPSGGGSAAPSTGASAGTAPSLQNALAVNQAAKTVTLALTGGNPQANYGFEFNGTSKGQMVVTVPEGWTVNVNFTVSKSSQAPHSAVVVASASDTTAAFPGAETPNPTVGDQPGSTTSFHFVASRIGTYRIACLVPGHESGGMWATLKIVSGGVPSVQ